MQPMGPLPTSMRELMREYQTITQNLANASTNGYKRRVNSFSKFLEMQEHLNGRSEIDKQLMSDLSLKSEFDFSQGAIKPTGRKLDVALYGNGWFVMETPDGPMYTRNGRFQTNHMGQLTDTQGRIVAGQAGPIVIPKEVSVDDIYIGNDGTVSAGDTTIGRLRIVDLGDAEKQMMPNGEGGYSAPQNADIRPAENISVRQGAIEPSNVNVTKELVDLMTVMRMYEASVKVMGKKGAASKSLMNVAMG